MKKIAIIICFILILLTGCSNNKVPTNGRFLILNSPNAKFSQHIIVDKETGVMYLYCKAGYSGGLSVMVDDSGRPLIYEEKY